MGITRIQRLRQSFEDHGLDALLVSNIENRRYLSGFTGSTGWLLISSNDAFLAVDFRYVEQAKNESPEFNIIHIKSDMSNWLPQLASDLNLKNIGFEAAEATFDIYNQLCNAMDNHHQIKLIPTTGLVESMRIIKEPEELEFIKTAAKLADHAIEHAKSIMSPGMKEKEIAWELEKFLREEGSEKIPFDIIVASGPNSALPHAKPSERVIRDNEPIMIDLGAKVNGYCSDLSRTLCIGEGENTFQKIYDIVLGAQLTAMATIEAGMSGDKADQLARIVINQADYSDAFGHSLGHGIGLSAHELPRLGPDSSDSLADGMVFTIEPGIYLPGWGGVRIEDTVTLINGKVTALTKANKTANI